MGFKHRYAGFRAVGLVTACAGLFVFRLFAIGSPVQAQIPDTQFRRTGLIFVSVEFETRPAACLFDTGSNECTIDSNYFEAHLKDVLPLRSKSTLILSDRQTEVQTLGSVAVTVRDGPTFTTRAAIMDLAAISIVAGAQIDGIIGFRAMGKSIVELDGSTGSLAFRGDGRLQSSHNRQRFRLENNRPVIPMTIPIIGTRDFLLDTGMSTEICFPKQVLQQLERAGYATRIPLPPRMRHNADGSSFPIDDYILRRCNLGGIHLENIPASTGEQSAIGMRLIRHLRFTIDCKLQQFCVELRTHGAEPSFCPGGNGFNFVFDEMGEMFVRPQLRPGGPAELVGIRAGDEIMELDGKPVDEYTFYSVTDRFSQAGTKVHLKFRRDGKDSAVDLVLAHPYQYPPEWPPEREEFNPDAVPEKQDDAEP